MKIKKRIAIHVVGYMAFVFLLLLILENTLSFLVSKSTDSQTGKVNLVMGHQIDPEVAIFGSSVAEVGFDSNFLAENLNTSVYNLAIDGTPILKSKFLIEEFLTYSQNCKSIVIGLAFFSFSEQKGITEPSRYLAHKSNIFLKENIREIAPELYHKLYFRPFYSFVLSDKTYYKNAILGLKDGFSGKRNLDKHKGFIPHDEPFYDTDLQEQQYTIGVSDKASKEFEKIIRKIQSKNIEVSIVILPMYIDGQNKFLNFEDYIDEAKRISKETNCRFFDFSSQDVAQRKSNYYNNGHLSREGARAFTESFFNQYTGLDD